MEFYELISRKSIDEKISEISAQLKQDFRNNIYTLTVLEGARVFSNYLIKNLEDNGCIVENDYIKASSYGNSMKSSGMINIKQYPKKEFTGKDVLIIEDIIDSGLTLSCLKKYLLDNGASSVKLCTLLDKPSGRKIDITPDYFGFKIIDEFVVGFGIDFNENYRELPNICYIK